jgi:hypothetical protein
MGSMAFAAISRMVWYVSKDKENAKRRLFLAGKNNMSQEIGGLAFTLDSVKVGEELIDSAVCSWENKTIEETAEEELAGVVDSLSSTQRKATTWLY